MDTFTYKPIGVIHSPFKSREGMPIQSSLAKGVKATIEVFEEYVSGLKDIEGFSHILLIYDFHQSKGYSLLVKPFLDDKEHGVFATRAPKRPNPIGLSTVRLINIKGDILEVAGIDVIDGTPLLDIKPYIPDFDNRKNVETGWYEKRQKKEETSDARFM